MLPDDVEMTDLPSPVRLDPASGAPVRGPGRHLVRIGILCMIAGLVNLGMAANEAFAGSAPAGTIVASGATSTPPHPGPPPTDVASPSSVDLLHTPRAAETLAYGPEPEQLVDVQWPHATIGAPALLYVHSGGWAAGTRTNIPDFLAAQRDNGWVVLSIDYRLAPAHHFPAASYDVDRAIRSTIFHADYLGIDPTRVVLAGGSAGGHLATTAAAAPGRLQDPQLPPELAAIDPRPAGLLALVAPTDLATLLRTPLGGPLTADLLGCPNPASCPPDALRDASPIDHVAPGAPPALFLYGALDTLVPTSPHGTAMAEAWRASNDDVTVLTIPGAGHNLDLTMVDPAIITTFLTPWRTPPQPPQS